MVYWRFCTSTSLHSTLCRSILPTLFGDLPFHRNIFPSDIMQFNHVVAAVVDLLNLNKYIPKVVLIHMGHSNFGVMPQHLIKFYMAQMANTVRDLICQAQPYRHCHIGIFVSLMLPETWYASWNMQKVARRARAHFNGCLAHAATMAGQYVMNHLELGPQDHPT